MADPVQPALGRQETNTMADITTLPEMITQMDADLTGIAAAEHDLERARQHFLDKTLRSGHISGEAREIAERDHLPAFQQAQQTLVQVGQQAARNARQVVKAAETARLRLAPSEEVAAAQRLPLFQQMVATAPLPQLADELRAALIAEDRPAMFALAMTLPARLDVAPDPLDAGRPEIGEARAEIRTMLARARGTLRDTSFDVARDRAQKVLNKAAEATQAIEARQRQAAQDADIKSGRKVAWPADPNLRAS